MDKSLLVRIFGFPATLIHGDTLVLDRWRWIKNRLPITSNNEKLIDIGCGTGAFTIGAALRGYTALGLSWDQRNQSEASKRAHLCHADRASFDVCDVRYLHETKEYYNQFDVAICTENIEHILDDLKLMRGIYRCLKPGGRLILTAPFHHFRAVTPSSDEVGPYCQVETGGHVRRGYTKSMLLELCESTGFYCEHITYCSGFLSQKCTALLRLANRIHPLVGWALILPLRPFIPFLDPLVTKWMHWPFYSIGLEAYKPRYTEHNNR